MSLRFVQAALFALVAFNLLGACVAGMLGSEDAFCDFALGTVAGAVTLWLVVLFEEWERRNG